MSKTNWQEYHDLTKNNPPSELLIKALEHVSNVGSAMNLGDGGLKDAKYLLEHGFDVTVVDQTIQLLKPSPEKLHCFAAAFDEYEFAKEHFDLASAMFALPFNRPETFNDVFDSTKHSLKKGGIFCGQFFGDRDGWSDRSEMTFHTKEQVEHLFIDMETISFVEVEKDSKTANGTPKHWHVFHVIARKS
jgi:SAM-dependent methyltransferase